MAAVEHQKYRVIKRLEAGGMAEVYLGEAVSVQGFKKKVAIKRVLPHLAQNQSFIEMFLDEARLSARLNHANIVSVFDISKRDDTYFLIMEFVDGVNLKRILESLVKRGQRMRLAEAVYLCIEACRGLSYAHEVTDEQGKPLNIVHRDISPPNIMVTRRGEVKLADFGLAKASTQIQTTDPGVVKGKFSYLSPEAANGLEVDSRTDIFAIGIVLWEILAGKRLFWGENDYATVKLIQKANVPRLSPLNREVDEAFEEVLLRALTRDPQNRYQNASEFGAALADYLFNRQLTVTSYDLARLVQSLMSDEGGGDDQSLIDRLIQEELDESIAIGSRSGSLPKQGSGGLTIGEHESLEDPASWFNDDDDLIDERSPIANNAANKPAAKAAPKPAPPQRSKTPVSQPAAQRPLSPGWNETGIAADRAPTPSAAVAGQAQSMIEPEMHELEPDASEPAPAMAQTGGAAAARSGGAGKMVVLGLVALAIAVLAWLGTRL